MNGRSKKLAALTAVGALAAGGIASAATDVGRGGGDDESPPATVSPAQAYAIEAAALAATGGGTANAMEADGENGATWEVEVTTPDGKTVDVRLDANLKVVVIEGDSEHEGPDDAADDGSER
jgi:uncharacterized membrane protein YkoI